MTALYKPIETRCDPPTSVQILDAGSGDWFATFTLDAYTVTLAGPSRRFTEGRRHVDSTTWVRLLPVPFEGHVDLDWLSLALAANEAEVPDILAIGFQYTADSPRRYANGLQIAGNARYGPRTNGSREEGADFNDYLGIVWDYAGDLDQPETRQIRALDCSGFVRMVFGYRDSFPVAGSSSIPLCRAPRADHGALPRRAHEMFTNGPGVVLIDDCGTRPIGLETLAPGDLLFFDADLEDGPRLDHVAIYIGPDTKGRHRFLSSRKRANGPTMADLGGRSILDGDGLYARSFRAARRV